MLRTSQPWALRSHRLAAGGTSLDEALIRVLDSQTRPVPHLLEAIPRWLSLAHGDGCVQRSSERTASADGMRWRAGDESC
jgi:hypothetical protein